MTIGGFAGFGFGVSWYAWGKVGFWKAVLYGIFRIPGLATRSQKSHGPRQLREQGCGNDRPIAPMRHKDHSCLLRAV